MNLQQLMAQSQKMQRQLNKAMAEIDAKEFTVTKGGAVTVTMLGDHSVKSISIDDDAFEKENRDMVQDMIALAINEINEKITAEKNAVSESITGQAGFGF